MVGPKRRLQEKMPTQIRLTKNWINEKITKTKLTRNWIKQEAKNSCRREPAKRKIQSSRNLRKQKIEPPGTRENKNSCCRKFAKTKIHAAGNLLDQTGWERSTHLGKHWETPLDSNLDLNSILWCRCKIELKHKFKFVFKIWILI